MTNLVDSAVAWNCFAAYTNNALRIEQVDRSEWNPARHLDRLPFDMPFQLVVGPETADRTAAETALTTVVTSMPTHIRAYYEKFHLIAPIQQWLIRRCKPGITNEALYVSAAAHPNVWCAADFDLARLSAAAKLLTSNSVPMMADLYPIYENFKQNPIKHAEPLVDYPDPRPEQAYETPFGAAIALRAPELRRKFRFMAVGYPFRNRLVNFKWMVRQGGVWVNHIQGNGQKYPVNKGYADLHLDWNGALRRDILVFARYGEGAWGPPSVISIYRIPNEKRQHDKDGRILSTEYLPTKDVIPQLYQNKPWKDVYTRDSLGNIIGFLRTRSGQTKDEELFSILGERVLEAYAGDLPKVTAKVRYFTRPEDPLTLDYEVTKVKLQHSDKTFVPRDRGEIPLPKRKK